MSGKVDWKFYFQRRKRTLEGFLSGVSSLEAAREKFQKRGLSLPPEELLIEHVEKSRKEIVDREVLKTKPKKTTPRRKKAAKSKAPKDTSNSEEKESPKDGKYFRKVFPKKKK